MARPKKVKVSGSKLEEVKETLPVEKPVETPQAPEPEVVVPTEESEAKKKFRITIEKYKIQNPVKYAQKETELLAKLNRL